MKFKRFIACVFALSSLLAVICFADNVTKQKLTLTYDETENTLEMGVYISKGTAIVGYCSFDYDEDVLTLLDKSGTALPDPIPDKTDDGKPYIANVVAGKNGVEITDVSKGSSKLINTDDGHIFFAWFLPSSIPFIDATSQEVLIANVSFKLNDGKTAKDLSSDSIVVAGKEITSSVSGWFPGLVVLDKDQKKFSYDGKTSGSALFEAELIIGGEVVEQPEVEEPKDDEVIDTEPEEPKDDEVIDTEPEEPKDDEVIDTEPEEPKDDEVIDTEPEEPKDDEVIDTKQEEPKDDIEIIGEARVAAELDFGIALTTDEASVKVKWTDVEKDGIKSYTIYLLDENHRLVNVVSGISSITTSYTISGLASGKEYLVYMVAKAGTSYYASSVEKCMTVKADEPTTIISNVFYDSVDGYLYGLSSELCVFGTAPTKMPTVIAPEGKYFIGWSIDEETVIDIHNTPIYSDTTFYALYSDKMYAPKGYINGYDDGTFKPDGNITRAEASVIISRLCDSYDKDMVYNHGFSDVQEGYWYENAVAYCYQKGYIKGYEDGTFDPYGNITRAEFATILYRVFAFDGALGINVFSDLEEHWGKNAVSILYGAGVIIPDKDGNFRPDEKLSRADAVKMISGAANVVPDREAILAFVKKNGYKFSDVPQYSEYFFDIYSSLMN